VPLQIQAAIFPKTSFQPDYWDKTGTPFWVAMKDIEGKENGQLPVHLSHSLRTHAEKGSGGGIP
jgi:hypothetical protein